jgi:hypothetical protein
MRGGKMEQFAADLLNGSLDDESQQHRGYVHPHFMGGEYLPSYGRQEVEIARIELASTTSDVISLLARLTGSRIRYRVVDEYETEFTLLQQTSLKPFSLKELIRFLNAVEHPGGEPSWNRFGFVLSYSQCNLECGGDLKDQKDFISVSSDYYARLASHYRQVTEEWYAAREDEIGADAM